MTLGARQEEGPRAVEVKSSVKPGPESLELVISFRV